MRNGIHFGGYLIVAIFAIGCDKLNLFPSFGVGSETQGSSVLENLAGNENGRTYDGKIVAYQSRKNVSCDNKSTPEVLIENNKVLENFRAIKKIPLANGTCDVQIKNDADVLAFEASQLAAYDGKLNDKILDLTQNPLDNSRTQIVCKMKLGPLALLDNKLSGAVIMNSPDSLVWNSRLDFEQRSQKTKFLFDSPPPGILVQTRSSLEFRTASHSVKVAPGIYELIHIKIQRSNDQALSPSVDYGKKIYDGTFQYMYVDYNQSPIFSVSISAMPSTCFVNNINLEQINFDLDGTYDFTQALLTAMSAQ